MTQKRPNQIDVLVGSRLRLRRLTLGFSQGKLADGLGITFQQVQKYEKGTNRIGASRLMAISEILQVRPEYFFQDDEGRLPQAAVNIEPDEIASFIRSSEGIALNRAFVQVMDPAVRKKIVALAKALANQAGDDEDKLADKRGDTASEAPEHRL